MKRVVVALGLLALGTAPLAAQEEPEEGPNALRKGTYSLSFDLPSGGESALGVWRMLSERTNLGLTLEMGFSHGEQEGAGQQRSANSWKVGLGVVGRRYLVPARPVVPFLTASASGAYAGHSFDDLSDGADASAWAARTGVGAGLEWFPVRSVSVAGSTGVAASYNRAESPGSVVPGPDGSLERGKFTNRGFAVGTFTSRLTFQIYF